MSSCSKTMTRVLIWLATLAIPVGQLPAASCGCAVDMSRWETTSFGRCVCSEAQVNRGQCCCARPRTIALKSCCTGARVAATVESSCCQADDPQPAGCSCGDRCRCGEASSTLPILPPTEHETVERLADSLAANAEQSTMLVARPASSAWTGDAPRSGPLEALACCISLCRLLL